MNLNLFRKLLFCFICFLSFSAGAECLSGEIYVKDLPKEARKTLFLIKQNGPFPYKKDGTVFGNYERCLPKQKRGYYREFTVKTPRAGNRGTRRIISGNTKSKCGEYYYTANHYRTFKRIRENGYECN